MAGSLADDGWPESAALVEHGLLDDLVGPDQHCRRDRQPEPLGRPYIDGQGKPYGLFHRQVARLCSSQNLVHEGSGAAPKLGLQVQVFEARDGREIRGAFTAMARERTGAVLVYGSSMLAAERTAIADLAAKNRLPTMCPAVEWMDAGFVISYGTSLSAVYRRAPYFVDRILKGAKPGDLPVEQPTKFELAINAKTAKVLGLTIPQAILARADQVIDP